MKKLLAAWALVAVAVAGWTALGNGQSTGATRTELGRGSVAGTYEVGGAAGSDVVVQSVEIAPGATAAWHTHPGPEVAIVKAGTLTFFDGSDPDCASETFEAGEVAVGSGHIHQGRNLGDQPVEIVVTYFNVPAGGAAATPAERPAHCPAD